MKMKKKKLLAFGLMALLVLVGMSWDKILKMLHVMDEVETELPIQDQKILVLKDPIPQWALELNDIPLPSYWKDSHINVYFKYKQLVNGYEVTARWIPYDSHSETGTVILNFRNRDTGEEFQYFGYKYNSFDTDDITFAKNFMGHKNGDVYYFNYKSPDSDDPFKEVNGNSPLGYYTSFQFMDIDFDGRDELLVSDMCKGKSGNTYDVYKVTYSGLQKLYYMPLNRLTNVDKIDLKKKTITIIDSDGAYDGAEFYFSFKKRRYTIKQIPKFYSFCAELFNFEVYNKELGSPFVLDSIKEYSRKDDREYRVKYIVNGSKVFRR